MSILSRWNALGAVCLMSAATLNAASATVEVRHETTLCVTYSARLAGDYLVIQATHETPWHTNSMDNKVRVEEKLAGKKALGVDQPTEFKVTGGAEVQGPWYQTVPKDLSKPDLRWYTWVFEGKATFAAKVKRTGTAPIQIGIRGQACTESTCKNIDSAITLTASSAGGAPVDLKSLTPVREAAKH